MFIFDMFHSLWQTLVYLVCLFLPKRYFYKDVSQETVLITGGGSGIGRLLALMFSGFGCHVIILDVNKEGLDETTRLIIKSGGSCRAYQCDISKRDYVYSIAEKIKQENGFVSIVINNAGITGGSKRILELNDERIIKTMEVNALAHFWMIKAFLPEMKLRNHGHIVTISSFAGLTGSVALADYCASKFAAVGIAESLMLELRADGYTGINSTIVCPFFVDTGLFKGASVPLIPTLEPKFVAEKIVEAVLLNQKHLLIPNLVLWLLLTFKTVFPVGMSFKLFDFLDGKSVMDKFTGREEVNSSNHSESSCLVSNNNETTLPCK